MAYNDMYGNNKERNKLYDRPTTNGPIFENPNSSVDPSRLKISYWNNMIKVVIEPKLNNGSQVPEYDKTNSIAAFLTTARAITLLKALDQLFAAGSEDTNSVAVLCKESLLTISKGKEFGKNGIYMVIQKVNGRDDLTSTSTYIYEFGTVVAEYLVNTTNSSEYTALEHIDYTIFTNVLKEFVKASTGAVAASVLTENSYNTNLTRERLNAIAQHLGIEIPLPGQRPGGAIPGRNPIGNTAPNRSSFDNSTPANTTSFSGNVEDDLLG